MIALAAEVPTRRPIWFTADEPVLIEEPPTFKPILFIDVDDTIIARGHNAGMFEPRPVMNLLRELTERFDCRWLTCVSCAVINSYLSNVYAGYVAKRIAYEPWDLDNKARTVLQYENWWWLEDGLGADEYTLLSAAGKRERYIEVDDRGIWGFHKAVAELYDRIGYSFFGGPAEQRAAIDHVWPPRVTCGEKGEA